MEQVLNILAKLGIDQTVFIQFGLFFVLYFVLKNLLFSKLQYVLDLRKEKTEVLDHHANIKLAEAGKMMNEYDARIEATNHDAHRIFSSDKTETLKREYDIIQKKVEETEKKIEEGIKEFAKDLKIRKREIMENADELSNILVDKMSK